MAWATELQNLVGDMKTSTKDRLQFVKDNKINTHEFLSESEKNRMKNFAETMKDIQARVKSIAQDTKDFLKKSEHARMADFKVTIKDIQSRVRAIQKHVADLINSYTEERKEAASAWATLAGSGARTVERAHRARRHGKK